MGKLRGKDAEKEEKEEVLWRIGLIIDKEDPQEGVDLEGHEEAEGVGAVEEDVWW